MVLLEGVLAIRGIVQSQGVPVEAAYVDLVDAQGALIAERRTGRSGEFVFRTTPGAWTLICRSAGSRPVERSLTSSMGTVSVTIEIA